MPYSTATVYAGLGAVDKAFTWLEKALEQHSVWLGHLHLRVDPRLDCLRSDQRFVLLLTQMGLED